MAKHKLKLKDYDDNDKIDKLIKEKEIEVRYLNRLYFIRYMKKGHSIKEASDFVKVTVQTGTNWVHKYNNEGIEGLYYNYQNCGRHCKLSNDDKKKLTQIIDSKNDLSMSDIQEIIKNEFDIVYSKKQVGVIVKDLGFTYTKAYPHFKDSPEDAEEQLMDKIENEDIKKTKIL